MNHKVSSKKQVILGSLWQQFAVITLFGELEASSSFPKEHFLLRSGLY